MMRLQPPKLTWRPSTLPEGKQALRNILLYHVYNGTVNGADVTDETKLRMMNGNDAVVRLTDGTLSIESATITTGDVIASNGVIHVIDAVLTPPENVEDESHVSRRCRRRN